MRRILLIVFGILFGGSGLLALYTVWHYDPDSVSPIVEAPSYRSLFDDAVKKRAGKPFAELDEAKRQSVLQELIESHEPNAVREVALYQTRELKDKNAAYMLLQSHLAALSPDLYEVAIGSVKALSLPVADAWLDSLYSSLDADPAAHTPVAGYRMSTLLVSHTSDNINADFEERSRLDADYSLKQAAENTLFFPASPRYFVSFPNADDAVDKLADSRFMDSLGKSPVPQDIWAVPFLRPAAALREKLHEKIGFMAKFFSPERLVRDNLSVAAYGHDYLFVSFKDKNFSLAERLMGLLKVVGKDFGIKESQVGDMTIRTIRRGKSGATLSYATVGDYIVAATDTGLLARAIKTYSSDRGNSLGVDPIFSKNYVTVDQSGNKDIMFAWFNPAEYFEVTGSEHPAARRLAIVARALGRPLLDPVSTASAGQFRNAIGTAVMSGADPSKLWRYVIDVRSLGKNAIDSLAQVAGVDIGHQIAPFLAPSLSLGYAGVAYLKQAYGYSNTSFNMMVAIPLRNVPPGFDSTLRRFFGHVTSLAYTSESIPGSQSQLWIAGDSTTNDSTLREAKLQPSFAIIDGKTLLIASTPATLRKAAADYTTEPNQNASSGSEFFSGSIAVDSLAGNGARYLTTYLLRSDRYPREEITTRIDPLRKAFSIYQQLSWKFRVEGGLRRGEAQLLAKK